MLVALLLCGAFAFVGCGDDEAVSVSPQAAVALYEDAYNSREPASLTMILDPDVSMTTTGAAEAVHDLGDGDGREEVLQATQDAWASADPVLASEVVTVDGPVATVALAAQFADGTEGRYTETLEVTADGRIASIDLALERVLTHVSLAELNGGSPDAVTQQPEAPMPLAELDGGSPDAVAGNAPAPIEPTGGSPDAIDANS